MPVENIKLSYEARALKHPSPMGRRLLSLMAQKETNLCASLDVRTTTEFLRLLEILGPYIVMVKSHVDIIDDFSYEDRKFADIGSTVKAQFAGGVYKIAKWADITNAHSVPGAGIVKGLKEAAEETTKEERGLIMLAELSSKGSLAVGEYTAKTVDIARSNKDFVFGFVAQNRMVEVDPQTEDWLILSPGVGLDDKGDNLGQQYRTVDTVIEGGSDVIIVGRGLFGSGRDPAAEGKRYRDAGWAAYLKRIGKR